MPCRGVRGATTVASNDREEILTATRQLLALNDAQVAAKVTTTREGVAPIFSVSVCPLCGALWAFPYATRVRVRAY